jgi:GNAT superfamily N-acetyltransferase
VIDGSFERSDARLPTRAQGDTRRARAFRTIGRVDGIRLATREDAGAIEALMRASIHDIFPAFYAPAQVASSIEYVGRVDRQLIDDGTYFVIDEARDIIACGGWSVRDKLYTGSAAGDEEDRWLDPVTEAAHVRAMFVRSDRTRRGLGTRILEASEAAAREAGYRRLTLMATLPGYELYERYGFRVVDRTAVEFPDGVSVECVEMDMDIRDRWPA